MNEDSDDELATFARTLIAEGRRDREVLRERWQSPRWRDDVLHIATALERNPALVPAVEACIAAEVARSSETIPPTTEATR